MPENDDSSTEREGIWKRVLFVVGFTVVIALVANWLSPSGLSLNGNWDGSENNDVFIDKSLEIDSVTVEKLLAGEQTIFVDAREKEEFDHSHIDGAIPLPMNYVGVLIRDFKKKYPFTTPIVSYSNDDSKKNHQLAQKLIEIGYVDVRVYVGSKIIKDVGIRYD